MFIHEGQLRSPSKACLRIADFGDLEARDRVSASPGTRSRAQRFRPRWPTSILALGRTIEHALANEEDALTYALEFGRGIDRERGRKFVRMYVNEDTMDLGEEGERALRTLYERAARRGLLERAPDLTFVG